MPLVEWSPGRFKQNDLQVKLESCAQEHVVAKQRKAKPKIEKLLEINFFFTSIQNGYIYKYVKIYNFKLYCPTSPLHKDNKVNRYEELGEVEILVKTDRRCIFK